MQDNGIGFDPEIPATRGLNSGSFGLINMRERARLVGGELTVHSDTGQGTFDSDDSSPAKVVRPATTSTPHLAPDNPTSGSLVAPDPNFEEVEHLGHRPDPGSGTC